MPIPECGCWIWLGGTNGKDNWLAHGKLWFAGKTRYVHRVVWFLIHGVWPSQHVHHKCSVRLCCNPEHLDDVPPIVNYTLGRGPDMQFKTTAEYQAEYNHDAFELGNA